MDIVAVVNQKGGVGKTTTVHNLASQFAKSGKSVLLIDMDAQGSLTDACGLEPDALEYALMDVFLGYCEPEDIKHSFENYDLIPANVGLSQMDISLAQTMSRENLLKNKILKKLKTDYDIVLIDCPPSLGIATINAMTAADFILIPVGAEYHPMKSLGLMYKTIGLIRDNTNENLKVLGILLTFYDKRKVINRKIMRELVDNCPDYIFETKVRANISLAEAPAFGKDIYDYKGKSHGAIDYATLANEILEKIKGEK